METKLTKRKTKEQGNLSGCQSEGKEKRRKKEEDRRRKEKGQVGGGKV